MATYNRYEFLERSIKSVLTQTFTDFEFIIVNNGSKDDSLRLCQMFAEKDSRIKIIDIEVNNGAPPARNRGLAEASCEYVALIDDDDYCEPAMLEYLWKLVQKHEADIAMCGSWNDFNGNKEPYFIFDELLLLDKAQGLEELLKREKYNVAPPTKLFRKSLFNGLKFKENVLVDDIHIIYKVFAQAERVIAGGKPLYNFVKHSSNMTGFIQTEKLSPELLSEYLSAFSERTKYLTAIVPAITDRVRYSEWSFMISMCNKIMTNNLIECYELYQSMSGLLKQNYTEIISAPFIREDEIVLLNKIIGNETVVIKQ
jgi:glycosyltransferase involved in cell wall biosynthesis